MFSIYDTAEITETEFELKNHDEPFYSGREFSLHFAYFAGEDEPTEDTDELDKLAFQQFQQDEVENHW